MQGEVVRLLESEPCRETAGAFARLADEANCGAVIGAIVIAFHRRHQGPQNKYYSLVMTGVPSKHPTLAAGAMGACKVLVDELALEEAELIEL